eukprot:TRINITY_DN17188_c0_g1_i1.p1 TRINITY_DN17188_c0_g1~~TRINITY_DN17188_c0_g1_i1.p1  ORF type:complete len:159 (+),score=10.40 TRINITY_DN17188_c0_g1_i1:76-552(+)
MFANVPVSADKMQTARGDTPAGTVGELQQKHLLALNLRSAPSSFKFVPRAYYLPRSANKRSTCDESVQFKHDFKLSQAVVVLQRLANEEVSVEGRERALAAACTACNRYLELKQRGRREGRGPHPQGHNFWTACQGRSVAAFIETPIERAKNPTSACE